MRRNQISYTGLLLPITFFQLKDIIQAGTKDRGYFKGEQRRGDIFPDFNRIDHLPGNTDPGCKFGLRDIFISPPDFQKFFML